MLNFELRSLTECAPHEKQSIMDGVVKEIFEMAVIAKEQGIPALDECARKCKAPFLLQMGIFMVVDGTDPSILANVLSNLVVSSNKTGAELLMQMIIREGVLAIQAGHDPRLIKMMLEAYLGEEYIK